VSDDLQEVLRAMASGTDYISAGHDLVLHEAADRLDRMGKSLRDIEAWARAYPLTQFPKPDLKRAAEVLSMNGLTLDAISADAMRHVLDGIISIARDGLTDSTAADRAIVPPSWLKHLAGERPR